MHWLSHFGFHTTPFTPELPVAQRFAVTDHDDALDVMARTVEQRMSAALIAPAGSGKSALMRALRDRLPEARYRTSYIKVTGLSKRDMCREIAAALGAQPAGSYPSLVRRIQACWLNHTDTDGLRPVVIFDEAHDFRPDVLGMLRVLSNFEMDSRLVVSFVLAGQARLRTLLRRDVLEDVARRIACYVTLRLLSRDEVHRYMSHRCTVAGADTLPFDPKAVEAVYEVSRGNLRATDLLALCSLQRAADSDCPMVDANHVVQARRMLWP